jgi:tRNA pseudouridine38-40 synthase
LKFAINGLLPEDIAVCGIEEAAPGFHSRFDAKSKIYRYTILNRSYPSALASGKVYFCPFPLNVERMRQETKALIGRHDFKAFQAADKRERGSVKTIKKIKFTLEGSFIHIDIEADGFLYNMARNIIGTLVEIGRGRFLKGSLRKILLSRSRSLAGPTAPAKGLCLIKVKY